MSLGRIRRLSDLLALGAGFLGVAYGAYLVMIGPNSPYLTPEGATGTIQSPTLAGLIPIAVGLLAISAVLKRSTRGLWAASVIALVFSLVFLFSYAPPFAALGAVLLLAAVMRAASTRDIARR